MPGGADCHVDDARFRTAPEPAHVKGYRRRAFVVDICKGAEEVHDGFAVDGGVVNLGDEGIASLRQPVDIIEPFDNVHLPERAIHVQRTRVITGHVDAELAPVARLGQAPVANVIFEVEMLVVDPVWKIEFQRHMHEPALEQRTHVQASFNVRKDVLEAHDLASRDGRLVEDRDRRQVREVIRRLQVKELGVLRA